MMEDRITELETKLAFAEDLLDSLNQTVVRQQEQLDLVQQQLRLLNQRLQDIQPPESRSLRDEIPPHY
jgi:SlyX protein